MGPSSLYTNYSLDDDASDVGIHFVKTTDTSVAEEELRLTEFPKLVYYQGGLPSIYRGTDPPSLSTSSIFWQMQYLCASNTFHTPACTPAKNGGGGGHVMSKYVNTLGTPNYDVEGILTQAVIS